MRKLGLTAFAALLAAGTAFAQLPVGTPNPHPLFTPPEVNPFSNTFFTAPGSRILPDGSEAPVPVPEAVLGPGCPLRSETAWFRSEFLFATTRPTNLPPLITSGPSGTTASLNERTTRTLFGGNRLSEFRPGLRVSAGGTICGRWGADGSFLMLGETDARVRASAAPGGPVVGQPLINGATGGETALQIGQFAPGVIEARASTRLIGGDAHLRVNAHTSEFGRIDVLAGYRYLQLWDAVSVQSERTGQGPADGPTVFRTTDLFRTRNEFHGPQVGFAATYRLFDKLLLTSRATVALGVTHTDSLLSGSSVVGGFPAANGTLVGPTNSGRYERTQFSVLPAVDASLGYDITDHVRITAGYTSLYWSRVDRAAGQIDRTMNLISRPTYPAASSEFWMHGVLLGLEVRY